jgi:hypothetical protein
MQKQIFNYALASKVAFSCHLRVLKKLEMNFNARWVF